MKIPNYDNDNKQSKKRRLNKLLNEQYRMFAGNLVVGRQML